MPSAGSVQTGHRPSRRTPPPNPLRDQPTKQYFLYQERLRRHQGRRLPDVPEHIVSRFPECDAILLVHKGDVPFSFEGGKALEAIGGAGQTAKTMIIFTRMDEVKGPNIHGWQAKREYSFSGVRNVVEHQIAKSLTPEIARFMSSQLDKSSFYLGSLQKGRSKRSEK
jgi:hypothetical protein